MKISAEQAREAVKNLDAAWHKVFYGDGSDKAWTEIGDAIREALPPIKAALAALVEKGQGDVS